MHRQIGSREYPAAVFVYKEDATTEAAWADTLEIAQEVGPICGELHRTKESLLAALVEWNRLNPRPSYLCIYAHAGELGINSLGGRNETRVTWQELAGMLPNPVRYLWLVGCSTQLSLDVWKPLSGPVNHMLLVTMESAKFRKLVKFFASEIDVNDINFDGEIPTLLREQVPELATKTKFYTPAFVDNEACFIKAFPDSELKIRRFVGGAAFAPGLYDSMEFVDAENNKELSGDDYARYVEQRHYSTGELEQIRKIVRTALTFVSERLCKEPQQGKCIPFSFLLSRLLEQYGVWNYIPVGGVVVRFPPPTEPKIFFPDPARSNGIYGHTWVRVPPFHVVDLTLPYQEYSLDQGHFPIEPVCSDELQICDVPPEFNEYARSPISEFCPPYSAALNHAQVTYVPYGIMLPMESLEGMRNPTVGGLCPRELVDLFGESQPELQKLLGVF